MTDRPDLRPCAFSRYAEDFVHYRLEDSARARFATHLERCATCAALVTVCLFSARESGGDDFDPPRDSERTMAVSDRLTLEEADSLRRDFEKLLAWRALRCVGETRVLGVDLETALEFERKAVRAVSRNLDAVRARASMEAEELLGLVGDHGDPRDTYRRLRECDVLAPKPPRLPRAGDRLGRRRVIAWATRVMEESQRDSGVACNEAGRSRKES